MPRELKRRIEDLEAAPTADTGFRAIVHRIVDATPSGPKTSSLMTLTASDGSWAVNRLPSEDDARFIARASVECPRQPGRIPVLLEQPA